MIEGSITYDGTDSHCIGKDSMVDGERIASLLTTENLEFTIRTVTVREEYDTGDIIIRENGVSIPAAYKQTGGMNPTSEPLYSIEVNRLVSGKESKTSWPVGNQG